MEYSLLKEKVLSIVREADSELLERIYSLAIDNEQGQNTGALSERDIKWLEEQSQRRRNGLDELYSWQEIRASVVANRKVVDK